MRKAEQIRKNTPHHIMIGEDLNHKHSPINMNNTPVSIGLRLYIYGP